MITSTSVPSLLATIRRRDYDGPSSQSSQSEHSCTEQWTRFACANRSPVRRTLGDTTSAFVPSCSSVSFWTSSTPSRQHEKKDLRAACSFMSFVPQQHVESAAPAVAVSRVLHVRRLRGCPPRRQSQRRPPPCDEHSSSARSLRSNIESLSRSASFPLGPRAQLPARSRKTQSSPIHSMMDFEPYPPANPRARARNLPNGSSTSSTTIRQSAERHVEVAHQHRHRLATEVHLPQRLRQQHRSVPVALAINTSEGLRWRLRRTERIPPRDFVDHHETDRRCGRFSRSSRPGFPDPRSASLLLFLFLLVGLPS